ncbi:U4/U6 small nuclear ribonucleoprotein Prp31 homolog [Durio zibethinus]|uniref:U4/U6 small nuclear ribonucleoprotein Prp31 homolog n=1 Tax=Durio zibethinus TaxID=66656 RepID=A0A6P5X9S3_DURZI|nr:U4/U6 small nuclear ribonucleoprotein Prp31 homolog [Durio zibethinus]
MGYIAPYLSTIVGTAIAVKLMGIAGGLSALAKMPASHVDSIRGEPSGNARRTLKEEIHKKIEKWQEPPSVKQPKPFPVPDSKPKKKRGGCRLKKMKERLGEGYGMLSQAGSGKLRVSVGQSKLATKVAKKFKEKHYGSSGATFGMTSSLAFTAMQVFSFFYFDHDLIGIELTNPQAHAHQLGSETQSTYFSETETFSKIKKT